VGRGGGPDKKAGSKGPKDIVGQPQGVNGLVWWRAAAARVGVVFYFTPCPSPVAPELTAAGNGGGGSAPPPGSYLVKIGKPGGLESEALRFPFFLFY
jgi:hypothetical protein